MTVAKTLAWATCPSEPPTRSVWRPAATIAASVRAWGSPSSGGFGCQGRTAPTGAGHRSVSFDAGQRLIGVTLRPLLKTCSGTPISIVGWTVA